MPSLTASELPSGSSPVSAASQATPPRLWPGVVLVLIYWVAWATVTLFFPGSFIQFMTIFWTPLVVAAGAVVWWLFFCRLPWANRLYGVGCLILGGVLAWLVCHKSMTMGLLLYALPVALSVLVLWLVVTRGARDLVGWLGVAAASIVSWGYFTLLRVDGVTGALSAQRSWRWSPTAEDIFLEQKRRAQAEQPARQTDAAAPLPISLVATPADWPEFRGALRDGHVRQASLTSDWSVQPPLELWRRRVGPGWSSFAVVGGRAFTQEQRGEVEAVLCFDVATGQEIWSHEDKSRFEETVAGAGPRATPTFHQGQIFALGGNGVLNCLDAATGKRVWSRDISKDADAQPPIWGFSSSPLIAQGSVVVFAGGKNGKSVLAYDAQTGEPRWTGGKGAHSYSSPQLFTVSGSDQVLMVSDQGLESFEPATGKLLWQHEWNVQGIFRICQPQVVGAGQVLLPTGMGVGTRLLEITTAGDEWQVAEKWTSKDLKPYFNDAVSRDGHLYGFDGEILVCIELATGKKKWKKGRYGYGQVLLVGDQGQLLVVSEKGELVLTEATPAGLTEHGRFQAVPGKTWNHPVIAGGKLLVRNGEEMACYDIQPAAVAPSGE